MTDAARASELRPMTTPHPGREPIPEDYDGTEGQDYLTAYNAWRERWEPWMRERMERGYV